MKNFIKISSLSILAMMLATGCSSIRHRVADNSLDYQKAVTLLPVQLPADSQTHVFTPIYQVPSHTGENTLNLTNQTGKRFEIPKPIATIK